MFNYSHAIDSLWLPLPSLWGISECKNKGFCSCKQKCLYFLFDTFSGWCNITKSNRIACFVINIIILYFIYSTVEIMYIYIFIHVY